MFGLLDRLYTFRKLRNEGAPLCGTTGTDHRPEVISHDDDSGKVWFCFVPRLVSSSRILRRGIIPMEGTVYLYTLNSSYFVRPSTKETLCRIDRIYNDAFGRINALPNSTKSVNLLGVSLGNVLSVRLAGSLRRSLDQLVVIVGGSHFGLGAWDSILTGHIAQNSGSESRDSYEQELAVYSPIHYVERIRAEKITVRLGKRDLLIPFVHGQILERELEKRSEHLKCTFDSKSYQFAGHSITIFFAAIGNRFSPYWSEHDTARSLKRTRLGSNPSV
jgi:hypothetical protein